MFNIAIRVKVATVMYRLGFGVLGVRGLELSGYVVMKLGTGSTFPLSRWSIIISCVFELSKQCQEMRDVSAISQIKRSQ